MNPKFSDLMQKLEAERVDLSYKGSNNQPTEVQRSREKNYYHAGRAAAGATDKVALAAAKWLESQE